MKLNNWHLDVAPADGGLRVVADICTDQGQPLCDVVLAHLAEEAFDVDLSGDMIEQAGRKMAAADDMLAALQAMLRANIELPNMPKAADHIIAAEKLARAAIAKAEGRT